MSYSRLHHVEGMTRARLLYYFFGILQCCSSKLSPSIKLESVQDNRVNVFTFKFTLERTRVNMFTLTFYFHLSSHRVSPFTLCLT
jgi:hypothetical protein